MKKKILITERNNLNEGMLLKEFELVDNPYEADMIISQSTVYHASKEHLAKTIYLAIEPPRTDHRIWCYNNFDRFHTVFCHNPDKEKSNQYPFQDDDACQFYPTNADPYPFHTRGSTTITTRGVFYAGMINIFENGPDACGGINITPLRQTLGNCFKKELRSSVIIGIGWDGQQEKVSNWREDKHKKILDSDCDFVLALENTIYPNYLYEKIWDGFATDKVTLYLGDPRVEHHIPLNCFVDLRPYYNVETKVFDTASLVKYLKEITQEEYDEILKNARVFRETAKGKYREYMDKLTTKIIGIIKNG